MDAPPSSSASGSGGAASINPLTLSFSDRVLERRFRDDYTRRLLPLTRFNLLFAALLVSAYGLFDQSVFPSVADRTAFLRYGLFVPYNVLLFFWTFRPSYLRVHTPALAANALATGGGIIMMSGAVADPAPAILQPGVLGMAIVCSYVLVLYRLRFIYSAPVTWSLVFAFFLANQGTESIALAYRIIGPCALLCIQTICTIGCYTLERQVRAEYLVRRQVDQRTVQLDAALRRAEDLASRDPLTDLPNRRQFFLAAEQELDRCRTQGRDISIVMIDIDHFKSINDRYGHLVGDAVLRSVADQVRAALCVDDLSCRFGGEEFVIMCPSLDADQAATLAEGLRLALERQVVPHHGGLVHITASIGLASWPPSAVGSLDHLIDAADRALYQAKADGRNRVVLAPPTSAAA